jgi:hypothetical protein
MIRRWHLAAFLLLLGLEGCVADTLPTVMPARSSSPGPAQVPIGTPAPIVIPGGPPRPRPEADLACDEGEVTVPGYWDFFGDWYWVPGFCTKALIGYVYVPPSYQQGVYVRGHFGQDGNPDGPYDARLRPARLRFIHPPGLLLRSAARPGPTTAQPQSAGPASPAPEPVAGPVPAALAPGPVPSAASGGPSLAACLAQATRRGGRADPRCFSLLGGEIRVH